MTDEKKLEKWKKAIEKIHKILEDNDLKLAVTHNVNVVPKTPEEILQSKELKNK